jgi:hypothetical protein
MIGQQMKKIEIQMKQVMKKINLILVISMLLASFSVNAAGQKDYFIGKWSVDCIGTPGGDSKMIVNLFRKAGKLEGSVTPSGKEAKDIIEVEEMNNAVKVYFRHSLFKVDLLLERKDNNHSTGFLMGKFQATGVRIK